MLLSFFFCDEIIDAPHLPLCLNPNEKCRTTKAVAELIFAFWRQFPPSQASQVESERNYLSYYKIISEKASKNTEYPTNDLTPQI